MIAAASERGLCGLEFTEGEKAEEKVIAWARRFGLPVEPGDNPHLATLRRELDAFFSNRLRSFTIPLVYPGTLFQVRVWEELQKIPYAKMRNYTQLARAVGRPGADRAVGHC